MILPSDPPPSETDDDADHADEVGDEGGDPACWAEQFADELYGED